ncbi:hypothetical protein HN858_04520 [Candidatus Falkowbacteria bacterium]|jgi:hypothetical protein|nr:hypothetical protein [Candidatus Falkowbacteria bacterium]MBT5503849.1 hypothetical protein [Candidatus Falkowbacteria bacterium]MBT6574392.1 hypothetical protein [Candidatus Falkowbacteria bacterium]MBT7348909.1 hypothetical protein [Candidatus Falkowbacteria bacterium]MBT7501265.1 hypothetical protein [Candidatus Falkowbacteria bacterium]
MNNKKKKLIEYFVISLAIIVIFVSFLTILYFHSFERDNFELGVNFSNKYAEYLGLDWQDSYLAILDELQVKYIRLAAPWNEIEPEKDFYAFAALDWQIEQADKRGVDIILAIGRRTPHWPECHDPEWIKGLADEVVVTQQLEMMGKVIERYQSYDSIKILQVENEPLLDAFGECPPADLNLLRKEVAYVKTLDDRPILITDSGELSLWLAAANTADYFGTTMYRVTYNDVWGYAFYHLPPLFYNWKAVLAGVDPSEVYVSELQAEPWAPSGLLNTPLEEQKISMDAHRLISHVQYAKRTGFKGAYLWGAEWWYWLKVKKGDSSLWDTAQYIFK